jgi:hypothetical protein
MHTGGFTSFFTSLGFGTLGGFFIAKKKIREIVKNMNRIWTNCGVDVWIKYLKKLIFNLVIRYT